MRVKKTLVLLILLCLFVFSAACSSRNEKQKDNENIKQYELTYTQGLGTEAVTGDTMVCTEFVDSGYTFYSLNLETGEKTDIGVIPDFIVSLKSVIMPDSVIYYYAASGNSETEYVCNLYKIDYLQNEFTLLSTDDYCHAMVSLFSTKYGLLALKVSKDGTYKTYFELISTEDGAVQKTFDSPEDETFALACVSDDRLYVLTFKTPKPDYYDYYLKEYSLDDFAEIRSISLVSIKDYLDESQPGVMRVMGDYVFFQNWSSIGMLAKINDSSVSEVLCEHMLAIAQEKNCEPHENVIFYYELTDKSFLFNYNTGAMTELHLPLDPGNTLMSISVYEDQVLLRTYGDTSVKHNPIKEKVYLINHDCFEHLIKSE